MSGRQLVGVLALSFAAWAALRRWGAGVGAEPATAASGLPGGSIGPTGYDAATIARESGGRLYAKNPASTASGKYQFLRATWIRMGGTWGPDLSKAFGGLRPSEAEQDARYRAFTAANAAGLNRAGIPSTKGALYAAHFLGLAGALRVLTAAPSTNLAALVGSAVIAANPQLRGFTVGDFRRWIEGPR